MRFILACLALLATPAHAATVFATPSTFAAVMGSVRPGDTVLMVGQFGQLDIAGRKGVTLDFSASTSPAGSAVERLTVANSSDVTVKGLTCVTRTPVINRACLEVFSSSRVSIDGATIRSRGVGNGLTVAGSTDTTILNASVTGARNCAAVYDSTGFTIRGLKVSGCQIDGLDLWRVHSGLVDGLECRDFDLRDDHHPDCLQLLSAKGQAPTSDVTVQNSTSSGPMQGFSAFDHGTGGYDRITFIGNRVQTSYAAGLYMVECRSCTLVNNAVETLPGAQFRASITVTRVLNLTSCGNSIAAGAGKKGVAPIACKP